MEQDFIKDAIIRQGMTQGFDVIGFSKSTIDREAKLGLIGFLRAGFHGDMGWLKGRLRQRLNPRRLWHRAETVIVLGISYCPDEDPLAMLDHKDKGLISAYARSRDYHDSFKKSLRQFARWLGEEFDCQARFFVDTAPVMEKRLAQQAGLGWQGKHSNLVSRDYGSWLFLGEIMTDLSLPPDQEGMNHCGSCSACLDICPTRAFTAPYQLDARRCISYLTIEYKGVIERELRPLMGNRIFGCDDCLAVCPWNKFAQKPKMSEFIPYGDENLRPLVDYLSLDSAGFRALFAGTAVYRTGRHRFLRNVLIAVANGGCRDDAARIIPLLQDESPLVRGMAVWALARLASKEDVKREADNYLKDEQDSDVCDEWQHALAP